ncbi:MAG: HalOD1 output domain-containing protein [Halalkalicoccus sp.]
MDDPCAPLRTNDPTPSTRSASSVSESIVVAVADEEGVSPMEGPPLYSAIDPDALDTFVDSLDGTRDEPRGTVTFAYGGYEVTVTGAGDISITKMSGGDHDGTR